MKTANLFNAVGCNGTEFRPIISNSDNIICTQMEYRLGLTYISEGLGDALDKAWSRIWRRALTLPLTTSGPVII